MSARRPHGWVGSSARGRGEGSCQQAWLLTEQVTGEHRPPESEQLTRRSFLVASPGGRKGSPGHVRERYEWLID